MTPIPIVGALGVGSSRSDWRPLGPSSSGGGRHTVSIGRRGLKGVGDLQADADDKVHGTLLCR
jgi:hypothetical protein